MDNKGFNPTKHPPKVKVKKNLLFKILVLF
jgi:hypothetical protein